VLALADTDNDANSAEGAADNNIGLAALTWDAEGNLGKVCSVTSIHVTLILCICSLCNVHIFNLGDPTCMFIILECTC
jgi:hypothetical protein